MSVFKYHPEMILFNESFPSPTFPQDFGSETFNYNLLAKIKKEVTADPR